jgi:alkylation response protein AidB-like acyl-CoA dehydrogenase
MLSFRTTEEQDALIEMAARFTKERIIPVAAECDRDSRFPTDVFEAAWELGLVNSTVPEEYGGAGMGETFLQCGVRFAASDIRSALKIRLCFDILKI